MEKNRPTRKGRGGRPAKDNPAIDLPLLGKLLGPRTRPISDDGRAIEAVIEGGFYQGRVFEDVFRVIKTDRGTLEYVAKLTQLHAQYRARQRTAYPLSRTKSIVTALQAGKSDHAARRYQLPDRRAFRRAPT